jgi:hypothetical protein
LALHRELERTSELFGASGAWAGQVVEYLNTVPPRHDAPAPDRDRLWIVVQGYGVPETETKTAIAAAVNRQPAALLVAESRIDQSYEPRIVKVK